MIRRPNVIKLTFHHSGKSGSKVLTHNDRIFLCCSPEVGGQHVTYCTQWSYVATVIINHWIHEATKEKPIIFFFTKTFWLPPKVEPPFQCTMIQNTITKASFILEWGYHFFQRPCFFQQRRNIQSSIVIKVVMWSEVELELGVFLINALKVLGIQNILTKLQYLQSETHMMTYNIIV